jgi:hypothetical protein
VNGRIGDDYLESGRLTCRNSSVDYYICSSCFFEYFCNFKVVDISRLYSDVHFPLVATLQFNEKANTPSDQMFLDFLTPPSFFSGIFYYSYQMYFYNAFQPPLLFVKGFRPFFFKFSFKFPIVFSGKFTFVIKAGFISLRFSAEGRLSTLNKDITKFFIRCVYIVFSYIFTYLVCELIVKSI